MSLFHCPIKVNQLEIKNRLVMPPMATGKADLIGVGRAILKDDLWAQKAMEKGQ